MNSNDNAYRGINVINPERVPEQPFGERCLSMLGYENLIGTEIYYKKDGQDRKMLAEDFEDVCGENARLSFLMLEKLDANNPDHKKFFDAARAMLEAHLGIGQRQVGN